MAGQRLLFFDLGRIIGILLIVLTHILGTYHLANLVAHRLVFNVYDLNMGVVGVSIILFVSGAVLEYSHADISSIKSMLNFYYKRLLRIYPPFWLAIILCLIITPGLFMTLSQWDWIVHLSGFTAFLGLWGGKINGVFWFIGLIVSMYMLFPLLSGMVKRYPWASIILFIIISFGLRYLIYTNTQFGSTASLEARWLPFCNLFAFGLGIFVVRMRYYPQIFNNNTIIRAVADACFYIFLVHGIFLYIISAGAPLWFYTLVVAGATLLLYYCDSMVQIAINTTTKRISIHSIVSAIKSEYH